MTNSTKPKKPTDSQKPSDISKSSDGSDWKPDPELKDKIFQYLRVNTNDSEDTEDNLKKKQKIKKKKNIHKRQVKILDA
jgi:hypothetical protein